MVFKKNTITPPPEGEVRITESLLSYQVTIRKAGKQRHVQKLICGKEELILITTRPLTSFQAYFQKET